MPARSRLVRLTAEPSSLSTCLNRLYAVTADHNTPDSSNTKAPRSTSAACPAVVAMLPRHPDPGLLRRKTMISGGGFCRPSKTIPRCAVRRAYSCEVSVREGAVCATAELDR